MSRSMKFLACFLIAVMGLAPLRAETETGNKTLTETEIRNMKQREELQQVREKYRKLKMQALSPQHLQRRTENEKEEIYWVTRRHLEADIDYLKREISKQGWAESYGKQTPLSGNESLAAKKKLLEHRERSLRALKKNRLKIDLERAKRLPKNLRLRIPGDSQDRKKLPEKKTLVQV